MEDPQESMKHRYIWKVAEPHDQDEPATSHQLIEQTLYLINLTLNKENQFRKYNLLLLHRHQGLLDLFQQKDVHK